MNLSKLTDHEILSKIKALAQNEREVLTLILHHLREVEKRKLFSELKYQNLLEYAMKELKYSEAQAGRRISAMRLLRELPQVEEKIQSGDLHLSNLCQAQSYFRANAKKSKETKTTPMSADEKIELLEKLENKSAREGEKLLLSLQPDAPIPPERQRLISDTHAEIRFVMDEALRKNLEEVRCLLGLKGLGMSFAELSNEMALMSVQFLKQKSFGKKRVMEAKKNPLPSTSKVSNISSKEKTAKHNYIPKELKFRIWQRDGGQCTICLSKTNLNYDHVHPKALGGANSYENLRLLCFHCNQRRSQKTYGARPSAH